MANLVSPGVSVTITDESFFIPAAAPTVPLIFLATAEEKVQADDITPAAGTYEHDVIRTVTSLTQSLELFGVPRFVEDFQGNQHHGDARNEYGLLALNQFLGAGNRAYSVRANVNLNDDLDDIRVSWGNKMLSAGFALENLVTAFIDEYNIANGLIPSSPGYKTTVTSSELLSLAREATDDVWDSFTFANLFDDFFDDNLVPASASSGFQTVDLGGGVSVGDATGLLNDATVYTATINVDGTPIAVSVTGSAAQTFTTLISEIDTDLAGAGTASIVSGNLQITSATTGITSTVLITDVDLFSSLTAFIALNTSVDGVNADSLIPVYENGYSLPSTGDYYGFDGMVSDCVAQLYCPTTANEFTAEESKDVLSDAADLFQFSVEFLNKTSLGANDAARRVAVVSALQASINSNTDVRAETLEYNLILCPGYFETVDELVALSNDIGQEAMVIADTPFDLDPDAMVDWADNDSARQRGTNVAYYYPHGLQSNIDGKNVMGTASGTALRTIAFSDNVAEVWFAPAGTQRGLVSGVTAVGYVSGTLGTATDFVEVALNPGQRDNMYKYFTNVNPIVFQPGRGLMVFGQKTSASDASARDRINVERMLMFIKRSLRKNTLPFLFQPNDQLTRDNLKAAVDGFLGDILAKRGLYDYATVCDESNNTADRIDRNEMYIDVALKPTKAAEFLYIPIRVVATDAELF